MRYLLISLVLLVTIGLLLLGAAMKGAADAEEDAEREYKAFKDMKDREDKKNENT